MDNKAVTIFQSLHPDMTSLMAHAPLQISSYTQCLLQGEGNKEIKIKQKTLAVFRIQCCYVCVCVY
jgi:hypothetical protein